MELIHTLNGVIIEEPIGFDSMKSTIKRHEYHGMSAEVSVGDLEFYGVAASIIKTSYNSDIDTELTYKVTTENGDVLYSGVIDLATYNEVDGAYFSVSCKVGEVGIKTTFNNRTDTYVDLNSEKTIDGEDLSAKPYWHRIAIPHKTLVFTNEQKQVNTTIYTEEPGTGNMIQLPDEFGRAWLNLSLDTTTKSEFGEVQPLFHLAEINAKENTCAGYADPFCKTNTGETIDNESDIYVEVNMECQMSVPEGPAQSNKPFTNIVNTGDAVAAIEVMACLRINGYQIKRSESEQQLTNDNYTSLKTFKLQWSGTMKKKDLASIYVGLDFHNLNCRKEEANNPKYYNNPIPLRLTIKDGSYIRATLYSQAKDEVSADMVTVYSALKAVVGSVSNNQLSLSSRLYELIAGGGEDGALKAITNGYKIRGLKPEKDKERNMSVSFKDMIESLNAIDCIGWGFDKNTIRVEKWEWFYNNNILLRIDNPSEIKRKIDESMVITELTIGYKKYATQDDFASIDSVHGERVFNSTTKAMSSQKSALCEFIADNYAIESIRRKALTQDEESEFKYDENIFIFALQGEDMEEAHVLTIPNDMLQDDGTIRYPEEMYNSVISPTRNAYRWISRLFCLKGIKPFKLTKGTINYMADFKTRQSAGDLQLLRDEVNNIPLLEVKGEKEQREESQSAEDMLLQERYYAHTLLHGDGVTLIPQPSAEDWIIPRKIRAEEISLTYPISMSEYRAIMNDPYGIVIVDGDECWIKEMQYDFNTSEAEFKLIPKAK